MEEALRSLLVAASAVTELVSTRIYWQQAPQSVTGNFINLSRISGVRGYTMQGDDQFTESRVQVDCWAGKYSEAKLISRAVVNTVSGFLGTQSGVRIGGIFVDSERDDSTQNAGGSNERYRCSLDLIIWHG